MDIGQVVRFGGSLAMIMSYDVFHPNDKTVMLLQETEHSSGAYATGAEIDVNERHLVPVGAITQADKEVLADELEQHLEMATWDNILTADELDEIDMIVTSLRRALLLQVLD